MDRLQPLQQQRQEHAALVAADRVDLINDHMRDSTQNAPGPAGQHQVKRFRRGDQNVRGAAAKPGAFAGGCITGTNRNLRHVELAALTLGDRGDAY